MSQTEDCVISVGPFVLFLFASLAITLSVVAPIVALADPAGGSDTTQSSWDTQTTFVPLAPIPGLTKDVNPTSGGIATFLNNLYIFLIGIAVILAVIMIIWGGVEYALTEAIPTKSEGKQKIQHALFGLLIVLSPVLVFSIINPAILNLNVNFPKLDTPWGKYEPASSGCDPSSITCISTNGSTKETGTKNIGCTTLSSGGTYDCAAEKKQCTDNAPAADPIAGSFTPYMAVQCQKNDGTIDNSGRTDSSLAGWTAYSCKSGETLTVSCSYSTTQQNLQ